MLRQELDLPLADTPASRFLALIAGGLVFLAVLAFTLAAAANDTARRQALQPQLVSVALPAVAGQTPADDQVAQVVTMLQAIKGVAFVRPVGEEELGKLVEPWLGAGDSVTALPMPRLIDVGFNAGYEPDLPGLAAELGKLAPGASVDQASPTGSVVGAGGARLLRVLALVAGCLALTTLVVVVVVVTRMSLDWHNETVDLLRLMGAADTYVARQFEHHALSNALRGGLYGFSGAVMTTLGFIVAGKVLQDGGLPRFQLQPLDWLLLACVPVVAALLTALVSRLTARRGLARLF